MGFSKNTPESTQKVISDYYDEATGLPEGLVTDELLQIKYESKVDNKGRYTYNVRITNGEGHNFEVFYQSKSTDKDIALEEFNAYLYVQLDRLKLEALKIIRTTDPLSKSGYFTSSGKFITPDEDFLGSINA